MLSPVSRSFEVDVQVEDAALKCAPKAALVTMFPFLIYDFEGNILIRWACGDFEDACFVVR